jgi:3-keto-disaccharide hydrolase
MKSTAFCACLIALTVTGCVFNKNKSAGPISIFDGQTLAGWVDQENSAGTLSGNSITNFDAFAKKLNDKADPVSAFLNSKLEETNRTLLADYCSGANTNTKPVRNALARNLNETISSGPIFAQDRFKGVVLRPEVSDLVEQDPKGPELTRLNKALIEDAYPEDIAKSPAQGWTVKEGAIASTGAGRGTLYTKDDYGRFRWIFLMRHVGANPGKGHEACVLIFCRRPKSGEKPLDAVGGIQFQVPNGGHWDYRPTENGVKHNNGGGSEFTKVGTVKFDTHEWSQVEIVADAKTGTARMAVAQPPGSKAVEVLDFKDPTAGHLGPIALQMHNDGLFDEYKDIRVEVNPRKLDLITTQ